MKWPVLDFQALIPRAQAMVEAFRHPDPALTTPFEQAAGAGAQGVATQGAQKAADGPPEPPEPMRHYLEQHHPFGPEWQPAHAVDAAADHTAHFHHPDGPSGDVTGADPSHLHLPELPDLPW